MKPSRAQIEADKVKIDQCLAAGHSAVQMRVKHEGKDAPIMFLIEEERATQELGRHLKFCGVNALWKGMPPRKEEDILHTAKLVLYEIPRYLIGGSVALSAYAVILFFTRRRKFWHNLGWIAGSLNERALSKITTSNKELTRPARILAEAVERGIEERTRGVKKLKQAANKPDGYDRERFVKHVGRLLALVIHTDCVYRWRLQDMMGELQWGRDAVKELRRVFKIAEGREMQNPQMKKKWKWLAHATWLLYLDRRMRGIIEDVLHELNPYEAELDNDDRYFAYMPENYLYDGRDVEQMRERWRSIEDDYGNTFLTIISEAKQEAHDKRNKEPEEGADPFRD